MSHSIFEHSLLTKEIKYQKIATKLGDDYCLFHMPEEPEEFLAALAAVEAYEGIRDSEATNSDLTGGSYVEHHICLDTKEEYRFLLPKKWDLLSDYRKSEWDLEVYLDTNRARSLCEKTQRNLADGFSLMIGGNLTSMFPSTISGGELVDAEPVILLNIDPRADIIFWNDLLHLLSFNFKSEGFKIKKVFNTDPIEDLFELVKQSAVVIGFRGGLTYLACARKRLTIEISVGYWKNYLSKFENPYYSLLWSEKDIPTATLVFRALQARASAIKLKDRIKWTS